MIPAMSDARASTGQLPTSEAVVAAHAGDSMQSILATAPGGDTNHVLCRGHDEPLNEFGRRVEWRLRALARKSLLRKVCFLLGPQAPHEWLACRQALATLIGLLSSGAEFELIAAPTANVDVVQTLAELMPHAPVGVSVSVRQEHTLPGAPPPRVDASQGTPDAPSHPGLARAPRSAVMSGRALGLPRPPPLWS